MATKNVIETVINTASGSIVLFVSKSPDVYQKSDIYNPELPITGKYFPALLSLVVDEDGKLYYVYSRDETDYSSVLKPCSFLETEENTVKVISYGNDKYCLYVDQRTDPYKLVVDAKLLFYGNSIVEYGLYRPNVDGSETMISMYYDATGTFVSDRVPMAAVNPDYPVYKYPTNCHTTTQLIEGETIYLRVRNNLGNIVAEITLTVRDAAWYNDLDNLANPIVSLNATCTQMRGDEFYIYEKQDPSHLNIQPYLTYADGTTENVNIDNLQCYLFGLENFVPSYPGYSQTLIIKYYLNYRQTTTSNVEINRDTRFITCEKQLVVLYNLNNYSCKISVIPLFNKASRTWYLRYFAYTVERDGVYDITDTVWYDDDFTFNGSQDMWGIEQHVRFNYNLSEIFDSNADDMQAAQDIYITVWDPDSKYEKYTFRDNKEANTEVYGADGSITRRPIIHYDRDMNMYFIPSTIFQSWDSVVESFYRFARPPFDNRTETIAPKPTHFTIRDSLNGQMVIAAPIGQEEYGVAWSTLVQIGNLVGNTVIVEFLNKVDDNYNILYGVPVDVVLSATGYNTESNNIYNP